MAKTKNTNANKKPMVTEDTNNAPTTIISEDTLLKSKPSARRNVNSLLPGELVTIRNRKNGAENQMASEYAAKLIHRNPDLYEILHTD